MNQCGWILLCLVTGCAQTQPGKLTQNTSGSDLTAILRREIPPGTAIDDAVAVMQAEGFRCEGERDGTFIVDYHGDTTRKEARLEGIDFVHCTRQQSGGPLVTNVIHVALILSDDEKVADIRVSEVGIGP